MKLSEIKRNKENPRVIKNDRFRKLVRSIQEFPAMMELRPLVLDLDGTVLGGNQRLAALKELGYTEIPDSWVKFADLLTEEEKKRFVVADNVSFGMWDLDGLLEDFSLEDLDSWGVEDLDMAGDGGLEKFQDRFNRITDTNAVYPIVPVADEKHELFIITCDSEVDANWLRERLGMQKMASYKRAELSRSNIISLEDLKHVL